MSDRTIKTYEGLFLFPQAASGNLQAASDHVLQLLERAEAEVLSFAKWDERRLAYEIKGNKRGVYFLTYFKAPTDTLARLERDCNLSEELLRAQVLSADLITEETIKAADGRDRLADEIRVRGEKAEKGEKSEKGTVRVRTAAEKEAAEAAAKAEAEAAKPAAPAEGAESGEAPAEAAPATAE